MTKLNKNGFTFKRFFIAHDKSPMKVTTDSCLLGAWAPITHHPKTLLDIGCGCGVIGLMLAQRLENTNCMIDSIDIDHNAVIQCRENIAQSGFKNISATCIDINDYRADSVNVYDLIVSNPPYFEPAIDCRNEQRQQARYTEHLNHYQLISAAKRLLKVEGYFCVVLPYHLSSQFIQLCEQQQLYVAQQMMIKYSQEKAFSLSLLCFGHLPQQNSENQVLVMRNETLCYSEDFRFLLQDFYLFRQK